MRFEQYRQGQPVKAFGYRWEGWEYPIFTKQTLLDEESFQARQLYFCDDPNTWASPWIKGMRLYEIHFDIRNPLVFLGADFRYENRYFHHEQVEEVRQQGFDAIIYTPPAHRAEQDVRQGCLLYPREQVLSIQLLQGDHFNGQPPAATNKWSFF